MSFGFLTYKKEFTELIEIEQISLIDVLFHRHSNHDVIFLFLNGPFQFFQVHVLLREKICPNSICAYRANDLSTTSFCYDFFFQFVSCLSPIIRCTHHTIPLVIGWTFEITPIIRIRIVYDTSGNRTLHGLPIWYFLNGAWILYYFILFLFFQVNHKFS